jgi:hypothetical protein
MSKVDELLTVSNNHVQVLNDPNDSDYQPCVNFYPKLSGNCTGGKIAIMNLITGKFQGL